MCIPAPFNSIQETLHRLWVTARAEAAAEDGVPADYYHRCTAAENFYMKPVLCSAHVVGITDPVKNRKRLEVVQAIQRQQDDWTERPTRDGPSYPAMYRKSNNSQEPKVVEAPINEVGDPRGLKEKLIDQIRAIHADLRNALDTLAYDRAKFHADCAARNIRTTEDADRAWTRIAVARAEVVSQEILELDMTLTNVVCQWAGGTGGARRQPATY